LKPLKTPKNPENPENPQNPKKRSKTCTDSPEVKIVLPDWQSGEDYFRGKNSCFLGFGGGTTPPPKTEVFFCSWL